VSRVERTFLRRRQSLIAFAAAAVLSLCGVTLGVTRAAAAPPFRGHASLLDSQTRQRMTGVSWHRGCPVPMTDLRLLAVTHWGFDGRAHVGRLVVNRDAARAMLGAMHSLYRLHYPIRQMRLVDAYGAVDDRSMAADNTSAFNCRFVAGTDHWSEHAYGRAIDLNPLENPYVTAGGYVSPPGGGGYADRGRHVPGLIQDGGAVVRAFAAVGWPWGGDWPWPKDFQHFSASGR
jgi:D-alanyl-D-alanine carboxypeptidase